MGVAVGQGAEDLPGVLADAVRGDPVRLVLQLLQDGVVHVFEDEVEPLPPPEHLQHVHQVLVFQSLWERGIRVRVGFLTLDCFVEFDPCVVRFEFDRCS